MADNVAITPGTGATVAADEIAGVLHQRVKITVGADGTNDGDVSSANPLPVVGVVDLGANNDVTVTGTVDLGATDNAVLDAIAADTAALVVDAAAIEVDLAAIEVLATAIDADTNDIKTAVQLLDNAVDGNYLNVNANIAGTDMVGGAGAVAAGVQRVTLASDDPAVTDLAAIEVLLGTIDADTGNIATATATPSSIGNGAKVVTTAGTAEELAGSTACKKIILCAKDSNTGKIYYGGSGVSATSGAYLYPGASVEINISNLSAVYIDSAVNGEGVQYTYVA